jgi:hypothetical protein
MGAKVQRNNMKMPKKLTAITLAIAVLSGPASLLAADAKVDAKTDPKADAKAKPYTLETCVVSGDKLGGMGDAYVFVYQGREIKLCCKSCVKDFNADPAKYLKKIDEAEAKAKDKKG